MRLIDSLDKEKQYHMNDLTLSERTTLMEEMYGKDISTIRYVNDSYRNQAMGIVYFKRKGQWRAQLSVNMMIAKSLIPFFRNGIKREYKNSQFIVI